MGESKSFIIGITGVGVSLFTVVVGWLPVWILFGVLVIGAVLYETKFFGTGIAGGFGAGVFASVGWLPLYAYFTPMVLASVFLAVKVAGRYVNIGGIGK